MFFSFDSYNFDATNSRLKLNYSFDNEIFFTETIDFNSTREYSQKELEALDHVFKYLHLVAGISYYKVFVPQDIRIKTFTLSQEEANFFNKLYLNGLGEFACRNNIEGLDKIIKFPFGTVKNEASNLILANKKTVAVGGGKDSIVSIELLKQAFPKDLRAITVNGMAPMQNTINIAEIDGINITRTIASTLLELNAKLQDVSGYNGHVPISAILSFIFCAASIIYGYDTVFLSNERSANIGNRVFDGRKVNHQWSKSFEFEEMTNNFIKTFVLANFNYISFLRPLSELAIAKIFAGLKQYHRVFTSCNKAFKMSNASKGWCCNCDKCRFVFLLLSNFLSRDELVAIFGKNLLDDREQLNGYKELTGLLNYKPFECVGEVEECIYSVFNTHPSFRDSFIIQSLRPQLQALEAEKMEEYFSLSKQHLLPQKLVEVLENSLK